MIGAANVISPCPELENWYYPQAEWVLDAIHSKLLPIDGYIPKHPFDTAEKIRLAKTRFIKIII